MSNCLVLEAHQKPTDKPTRRIKRSGGQSLVRQGLAEWIRENVLLRMRRNPIIASFNSSCTGLPGIAYAGPYATESGPSQSPRMGKLKWEPPKSKRQLKAHPWQNIIVERSYPSY